jgi:hypothetical protein
MEYLLLELPTMAKYHGRISYKPVEDKQIIRNTLIKAKDLLEKLGTQHFAYDKIEIFDGESTTSEQQLCSVTEAFEGSQIIGKKIPKLNEPVPDDWTVIEGEFTYVCLSG